MLRFNMLRYVFATSILILFSIAEIQSQEVLSEVGADSPPPSFRELLKPGQWVTYLNDELQIFTKDEMQAAITRVDRYPMQAGGPTAMMNELELSGNVEEIKKQLSELVKRGNLPGAGNPIPTFFEVFTVGKDYVGLRKDGIERFIQLNSVRGISRLQAASDANSASTQISQVPPEFELDAALVALSRIRVQTNETILEIAKEKAALARLEQEIAKRKSRQNREVEQIATLEKAIDSGEQTFTFSNREYSLEQVKQDLRLRLVHKKKSQQMLEELTQSHAWKEVELKDLTSKLDPTVKLKRQLETTIQEIKVRLRETRADENISELNELQDKLNAIKMRIDPASELRR